MKKFKFVEIFLRLNIIKSNADQKGCSIKFRYALNKNLAIINPEIKLLQEIEEENNKLIKEYTEERNSFILEKGKLDAASGQKFIPMETPNLSEEDKALLEEWKVKHTELEEKYKEQLDKFKQANEEYQAMLKETDSDSDVKFYKITLEHCPDWLGNDLDYLMEEGFID